MKGQLAASVDVGVSAENSMVEHANTPCTYADIKRMLSTHSTRVRVLFELKLNVKFVKPQPCLSTHVGAHQPRQPDSGTPGQVGRAQQQSHSPAAIFMIMAYACM